MEYLDEETEKKYYKFIIALVRTITQSDLQPLFEKNLKDIYSEFRQLEGETTLQSLFRKGFDDLEKE